MVGRKPRPGELELHSCIECTYVRPLYNGWCLLLLHDSVHNRYGMLEEVFLMKPGEWSVVPIESSRTALTLGHCK